MKFRDLTGVQQRILAYSLIHCLPGGVIELIPTKVAAYLGCRDCLSREIKALVEARFLEKVKGSKYLYTLTGELKQKG